MRVLTVRQPWAWAIIHGGKDVENRSRNIAGAYRGPVAIHVSQWKPKPNGEALDLALDFMKHSPADTVLPGHYDRGVVIGVVDLWAVHPDRDGGNCCPRRPVGGPGGSPWAMRDNWHLCLANPRALATPIHAKGRLGLWKPDDALAAAITAALASIDAAR